MTFLLLFLKICLKHGIWIWTKHISCFPLAKQVFFYFLIVSIMAEKSSYFYIGTGLHIDPLYTDAFNALISGKKWWVSMPKDLYEFPVEFTCIESCSNSKDTINFHNDVRLWYSHILPQLRWMFLWQIQGGQDHFFRKKCLYLFQFWSYTKILEYGKVWQLYILFKQINFFSEKWQNLLKE